MRFTARAFIVVFCLSLVTFLFGTSPVLAQTTTQSSYPTSNTGNSYNLPNTDSNVSVNQHTRVQTLMIDLMASTMCILVGIDPVDQNHACLDVNPTTGKIGYNPASLDEDGSPKIGGIVGASTNLISALYTPTISTSQYTDYLAQNFGIVKPAYAQEFGYGFQGLNPLLTLWTAIRNMAYFLLMVAFVIIGLGIMLRIEMSPRTIMTIQNQIPRIIVCIILVTFSYGIAGLLIDTMWLTTYVGINVITSAGGTGSSITNPQVPGDKNLDPQDPNYETRKLSDVATANLLQMPLTYVNNVFRVAENNDFMNFGDNDVDIGIKNITMEVSYSLGQFMEQLIKQMMGIDPSDDCGIGIGGFSFRGCFATIIGFLAKMLLWLIILITILKVLFSVWFTLLKAYTYVIIYSIAAPFFIVMGLLPGKPLGFEKWLRSMVANLAVFPVTAFVFVLARLFVELFNNKSAAAAAAGDSAIAAGTPDYFIAPLIGNPNILGLMGWLIAFGLLLMSPTMLAVLQESLKVTGTKHGAAIGAGLAAGAAMPKAGFGAAWNHATRKFKPYEHEAGWLRKFAAGKAVDPSKTGFRGWMVNRTRKWRQQLVHNPGSGK